MVQACSAHGAGPAQASFRLGVFTSASQRTARVALALLEAAAGPGPPLFAEPALVLHRSHTMPLEQVRAREAQGIAHGAAYFSLHNVFVTVDLVSAGLSRTTCLYIAVQKLL